MVEWSSGSAHAKPWVAARAPAGCCSIGWSRCGRPRPATTMIDGGLPSSHSKPVIRKQAKSAHLFYSKVKSHRHLPFLHFRQDLASSLHFRQCKLPNFRDRGSWRGEFPSFRKLTASNRFERRQRNASSETFNAGVNAIGVNEDAQVGSTVG